MRKAIVLSLFVAIAAIAKGAFACDAGGGQVQIILQTPPSPVASQQSAAFLAEATRLDGKADIEESASATVLLSARSERRKAQSIRLQASQASETAQNALLAKAEKLEAEAAANDVASVTFLARAKLIRARSKALRTLSTRVLTVGAVTGQVLARVQLPAAPANHPDKSPLRALEAVPKVAAAPMFSVKV